MVRWVLVSASLQPSGAALNARFQQQLAAVSSRSPARLHTSQGALIHAIQITNLSNQRASL